ncbi:hypothetical protein FRC02_006623 [Tulasnella sp. 418]|nr:hypothetical protein FRC02_006623 [Tulasnella sp. 418]
MADQPPYAVRRFIAVLTRLIPHRLPSPLPLPSTTASIAKRRNIFSLLGLTVIICVLANMLWGGINATEAIAKINHWQSPGYSMEIVCAPGTGSKSKAHSTEAGAEEWTLERIREVAESSKGYYARDFSLQLGWNNVRYIIETALLHAQLLDRTLILPTYVYARACEHSM